jgi:16S rRNA (adenine1518-N6/adenine1519-N6)-dimethyltransferase
MVRPKKYLGQHFLTDPGISRRIANALLNENHLPVLEIGPGKGILTKFIAEKESVFFAIETDFESVEFLKTNYPELSESIIFDDFLKFNLSGFFSTKICLIGNLPYNISSPILFKILDNKEIVSEAVFMLQKEVAQRICSLHGNKTYGVLSVLIQTYYDAKYIFTVNEGSFFPPPKVKSGVFRLMRNTSKRVPQNPDLHKKIVKAAFNQRRKTMRNSLKAFLLNLQDNPEWLNLRPEQCSVEDFIRISDELGQL